LVLNQVIVNFASGDAVHRKALTESVVARVPRGGVCYAAGRNGAMIGDALSVFSGPTTEADSEISAEAIIAAWRDGQKG